MGPFALYIHYCPSQFHSSHDGHQCRRVDVLVQAFLTHRGPTVVHGTFRIGVVEQYFVLPVRTSRLCRIVHPVGSSYVIYKPSEGGSSSNEERHGVFVHLTLRVVCVSYTRSGAWVRFHQIQSSPWRKLPDGQYPHTKHAFGSNPSSSASTIYGVHG